VSPLRSIYKSGIELAAIVSRGLIQCVRKQNCGEIQSRIGCSLLIVHCSLRPANLWGFRASNRTAAVDQHQHRFPMCCDILPNHTRSGPLLPMQPVYGIRLIQSCVLSRSQVARSRYSRLLSNTRLSHLSVREGVSLDT